jgi:dihydroorotate dehydrogenase (NAD+) catalytic subunit
MGGSRQVTRKCRRATDLPIIVKLTPNVTEILTIARAVVKAGADILSMVNTFRGMAVDVQKRRPALGNTIGGLSGPAIKPLALYNVFRVSSDMNIPIIGMGGIRTAGDALEFMMVGARAVAVGTSNFADPAVTVRIIEDLENWCRAEGLKRLDSIVGAALPEASKGRTGCGD